jgi:hypothetical protein
MGKISQSSRAGRGTPSILVRCAGCSAPLVSQRSHRCLVLLTILQSKKLSGAAIGRNGHAPPSPAAKVAGVATPHATTVNASSPTPTPACSLNSFCVAPFLSILPFDDPAWSALTHRCETANSSRIVCQRGNPQKSHPEWLYRPSPPFKRKSYTCLKGAG